MSIPVHGVSRIFFLVMGLAVAAYLGWQGFTVVRFYSGPSENTLEATGFDWQAARRGELANTYAYTPQYPFWSDGAVKERFVYIPEGGSIDSSIPDRWNFPQGTRMWKVFSRDEVHVETRMLLKHGPEPWAWDMAVYQPEPDGGVSRKLALAKNDVSGTSHDIPTPGKCVSCHGDVESRRPLGLTAVQLAWSSVNGLSMQQLVAENLIKPVPAARFEIPGDELTRKALGYLDTNCGSCHVDGSTFVSDKVPLELNLTVATLSNVESTNAYRTAIRKPPHLDGMGTDIYIEPGMPEESFLWRRMSVRDNGIWQMPTIATELIDEKGVALIREWILSLKP